MGYSVIFECTTAVYDINGHPLYQPGDTLPAGHADLAEYGGSFTPKLAASLDPEVKESLAHVEGHGHEKKPVLSVSDAHPGVVEKPVPSNSPVLSTPEPAPAKQDKAPEPAPPAPAPQPPARPAEAPVKQQEKTPDKAPQQNPPSVKTSGTGRKS